MSFINKFIAAAVKTSSGTVATLFFGILSTKIIAVLTGSAGIGLFSIIKQLQNTGLMVSTLNGNAALVQGIASRKDGERQRYINSVFVTLVISTLATCSAMYFFAPQLARLIFQENAADNMAIIVLLPIPVFLGSLLFFLKGVLNGFRAIGRLAIVTTFGSFSLLLFSYPLAQHITEGHHEAFVWLIVCSILPAILLAGFFLARGKYAMSVPSLISFRIHKKESRYFLRFAATTLATGVVTTTSLLILRAIIYRTEGLVGAGLFDVSWTLSMMYIGLVTKSFATYYLPTLSSIGEAETRRQLIEQIFRLTTILMIPVIAAVIVCKPLVIDLLYSEELIKSLDIMRWMLLGDYFKVTSWVIALPMLAHADMKLYFWSELLWNTAFLSGSYIAIVHFNILEGVGATFLLVYLLYFIAMKIYCVIRFKLIFSPHSIVVWLAGLVLLTASSYLTWTSTEIDWLPSTLLVSMAVLISWFGLKRRERQELRQLALARLKVFKRS